MSYLFILIIDNNIVYLTNSLYEIISELLKVDIESKNKLAVMSMDQDLRRCLRPKNPKGGPTDENLGFETTYDARLVCQSHMWSSSSSSSWAVCGLTVAFLWPSYGLPMLVLCGA